MEVVENKHASSGILEPTQEIKEIEQEKEQDGKKLVGDWVKRMEDPRLLTGQDQYLDNFHFAKMVYAGFVRSPYAHARIKKIDLSKVRNNPAVVAILTADEVLTKTNPVPVLSRLPNSKIYEHYALTSGKVKHVGDPILALAVIDRNLLEDVLELVDVEYEQLDPVLDPVTAEEKPPIHEEVGSNQCYSIPISSGDVGRAFGEAYAIVSGSFRISRLCASPMETRGVIALPNGPQGLLTVYSSTQWPHTLRTLLAHCLKISENQLRIIGPDVGGAFGAKGELYSEEIAVPLIAIKCGLPVKWVESRTENFLATTQARDQFLDARASFDNNGIITGLMVRLVCDFGAYLHCVTPLSGFITAISLNGPYRIRNLSVETKGVYTNKVGLSAYRGFGQPEAAFVLERLMSMAANRLGLDPSEIRFRNLISSSEMPYKTATGGMYDSGDYAACLRKALDFADYDGMISHRAEARREGLLRGIGISIFTEATGFAPSVLFSHLGMKTGGYDSATVKMAPDGKVSVTTGAFPHGQGFNTVLSQICADELGLADINDVQAFHGDTLVSPYGHGSFGSRTVAVAGSAAVVACRKMAQKVLSIGAHILKSGNIEDLRLIGGFVSSKSKPKQRIPISEVAKAAYLAHDLPKFTEPGLEVTVYYDPLGLAISYAAHVSEVEVDRESGQVHLLKHVSVHDCGRQINPMIVEGQIHGGVAQAIGECFLEEIVYDKEGQPLNGSFTDYLLPTAETIPILLTTSTTVPSTVNPLGAKGIGESGTIIAPPSFANAVSDAVGADMNTLPMTPERIWKALQKENPNLSRI